MITGSIHHKNFRPLILSRMIYLIIGLCLLVGGGRSAALGQASQKETAKAQSSMDRGLQSFQRGHMDQALADWKEATEFFAKGGNTKGQIEALTRLALAQQNLGRYTQALQSLELALALAQQTGNSTSLASLYGSLGSTYLAAGNKDGAAEYLALALKLAREQGPPSLVAAILNDQGILLASQGSFPSALKAYQESAILAKEAGDRVLAGKAMINSARAAMRSGRPTDAKEWLNLAVDPVRALEPSRDQAYALINIGLAYRDLRVDLAAGQDQLTLQAFTLLKEATAVAERLGDTRAASYAWGYLGNLYEHDRRFEEALTLTRRAMAAAQNANAPEALYQWQWQLGRILTVLGQLDDAIAAYRTAVFTSQSIRHEAALSSEDPHALFRDTRHPLYFGLADLLLQRAALTESPKEVEPYLLEAREAIELLKAAELRDYFRDECVDTLKSRIKKLDVISPQAAVVYPIIFQDRTEILVSLPQGIQRFAVPIPADRLIQEIRILRRFLEKRTTLEYLPHAQQVYDWLIRPWEPALASQSIDTLVFVPDGALRTIPMAALHDGKLFLIQKYAVATTPGLDLTDPRPADRRNIKILASGITESVQGFPSLPYVFNELNAIRKFYGGEVMLNQDFLLPSLEKELKEKAFTMVHIASHGKFDEDVNQTFILTFDGKLTMGKLDRFIGLFRFREDPLELLTLSACETAAGDDRAALGLAGVAVKAGAKSAVATLWFINDQASSVLVSEFYRQLHDHPTNSKAVALQRAQVAMLEDPIYDHPAYWSPFLLLNNWL